MPRHRDLDDDGLHLPPPPGGRREGPGSFGRPLQIRVSEEDRAELERIAASQYLKPSQWARQPLLWAIDRYRKQERGPEESDE